MGVFFTERYIPLYVSVSWGPWESGDADLYRAAFTQLWARRERYVTLCEARWSVLPGARQRQEIATMSDELGPKSVGLNLGNAAVLASRLAVGAATAVAWLSKRQSDVIYVSSAADGLARMRQRAVSHGVTLPPSCDELAATLDRLAARGEQPPIERVRALL
jgi:hypothetical protein